MRELPVDALRKAALLEQDDDRVLRFGERRRDHVGDPFAMARCGEIDIALADRGVALSGLRHQLEQRAAERHKVGQVLAQEKPGAAVEELFGGRIDEHDLLFRANHEQRHGQSGRNQCG